MLIFTWAVDTSLEKELILQQEVFYKLFFYVPQMSLSNVHKV